MAILLSPNTKEERSRQDDSNSEIQKELTSSLNNLESLIPENFENLNLFRCSCTNPTIRMNRFTSDIESNCCLSMSISVCDVPGRTGSRSRCVELLLEFLLGLCEVILRVADSYCCDGAVCSVSYLGTA